MELISNNSNPLNIVASMQGWCNVNALALMMGTFLSALSQSLVIFSLFGMVSFSCLWIMHFHYLNQYRFFAGSANWLTLLRLLLLFFSFSFFTMINTWVFFSLMSVAVALDVADGYVARKFNHDSIFGRFFDMEVDAFYVMGMGLYFMMITGWGLWLLLPGLLRYSYRLLLWLRPKADFSECKKHYAATLAGINFILLLLAIIAPPGLQFWLLASSAIIVSTSFSISFFEYYRYAKTN